MKCYAILLCFLFGLTTFSYSQSTDDLELKSIEKLVASTEKLTLNKSVKATLKRVRKQLNRVGELWQVGAVPNSLGILMEIRGTLYRYGTSESLAFQQNVRSAMKRLWPFLLKSGRFRSDTHKSQGMTLVRLIVPEGTITMSFPSVAKPGETVSGRIHATPESFASLYLLTVLGSPVVPDGKLRKWNLPQQFELVLNDQWGNEIVRAVHQVKIPANVLDGAGNGGDSELEHVKQPREAQPNIEIPHLWFQISSRAKAGEPIFVEGPFDGDFSTTRVGIGQYQGHVIGESPGRLILATHPKMIGDWTILLIENEHWVRCRVKLQSEEVDSSATLATCVPTK